MTSQKCPNCGMVNFASAQNCQRCRTGLNGSPASSQLEAKPDIYETADAKSRWSFSPLKALLLILLVVIPCWLYYRSQESARADEQQRLKKWEEDNPVLKRQRLRDSLPNLR